MRTMSSPTLKRELRWMKATLLKRHPLKLRAAAPQDRKRVEEQIEQLGCVTPIIAHPRDDGSLEILDGHLRAEIAGENLVPVVVLECDNAASAPIFAALQQRSDRPQVTSRYAKKTPADLVREAEKIPASYQLLVDCGAESQQRLLFDALEAQGLRCRVLTLTTS